MAFFTLADYCNVSLLLGFLHFHSKVRSRLPDRTVQQFKIMERSLSHFPSPLLAPTQVFIQLACELAQGIVVWGSPSQQSVFLMALFFSWISSSSWLPTRSQEQQHKTRKGSVRLVQMQQPLFAGQQMPQKHTCSVNENLAISASARGKALHLFKENVFGTQEGARNTDCTQHWIQVHIAATTGFFHTNTSDFPRYMLQVNCTDPIPPLPKFSSPTFQLASQHCSK